MQELVKQNHVRNLPPYDNGFYGCNVTPRLIYRLYLPFTEPIIAYHGCVVNEAVSLCNRHLVETIPTQQLRVIVNESFQLLRELYPVKQLTKISIEKVLSLKKGNKRKTYRNAYIQYNRRGIVKRDLDIQMFVKYERMSIREPLKPPRAIQARGPVFNLVLQQYVIPYAKHLIRSKDITRRFVTKGMDQYQIADLLYDGWCSFREPIAMLLDHDRFDSRANRLWTMAMHEYISEHFDDLVHRSLFQILQRSKCTSRHGIKYTSSDMVFSGDVTTSDGNSTINRAILAHYTQGIPCFTPLNGDDSVIIIDVNNLPELRNRDLNIYGFNTKQSLVYSFEEIEYCQCKPVLTINGWVMVRDPFRVISRSTVCLVSNGLDYLLSWYASVGECELSCNRGVPILMSFAKMLMRASDKRVKDIGDIEYHRIYKPGLSEIITHEARHSFALAFRITPTSQLAYENYFDNFQWELSYKISNQPTAPMLTVPYF